MKETKAIVVNWTLFFFLILAALLQGWTTLTKTSRGKIEKGETPQTVLSLYTSPNNPRNGEGDFITLKDGRILFIYTHFTDSGSGNGDFGGAYLASRYSTNGGKTWSKKDQIVLKVANVANIMSVSLLRLQDGNIALFYLKKYSKTDCIPVIRISKDEARTWGPPKPCITDRKGYFTVNNNRVIQLRNGRLLIPVSLFNLLSPGSIWHKAGSIFTYYSDDNGATWHHSKEIPNPDHVGTQEPGIVKLKNGQLLMFMRTDARVQYVSYSRDQGETWTPAQPSNIVSPISPASIVTIPSSGDLLLVWNNNGKNEDRTPLDIAISHNDGKTWQHEKALENSSNGSYCYTAIHFVGKYALFSYYSSEVRGGSVIKRVSIKWIYK